MCIPYHLDSSMPNLLERSPSWNGPLSDPPHQSLSSLQGKGMVGAQGISLWRCAREDNHSPSDGLPSPPVSEKGRPTKGVAGNPSLGEEGHKAGAPRREDDWSLLGSGLQTEGDSALIRQIFLRLPGPDSSPRVRAVPAGAPSARLGPQVSLAQRCLRASGVVRTSPAALGEGARCLQSEVTQSGRVGAHDTCASHGGHTEGSRVRDAPVWHKRGSSTHRRSVGLMAGVGTPTLSVPPRRGLEVTAGSCLWIPVVFPRKQAARIQCRMPP